jgi:hypothetical protein
MEHGNNRRDRMACMGLCEHSSLLSLTRPTMSFQSNHVEKDTDCLGGALATSSAILPSRRKHYNSL